MSIVLSPAIPEGTPDLYHYLSQATFLKFLSSGEINLQRFRYFHDGADALHAENLLREINFDYPGLNFPIERLDLQVFVAPLFEENNLPRQWNNLRKSGGVAISFDLQSLNASLNDQHLAIGKCIEGERSAQLQIIRDEVLKITPEDYKSKVANRDHKYQPMEGINKPYHDALYWHLCLIKAPSSIVEGEWRIMANFNDNRLGNLASRQRFSEGESGVVPVLPVAIGGAQNRGIAKLKVGPYKNYILATESYALSVPGVQIS